MELNAQPRSSQQKLAEGMIPAVAYRKDKNVAFSVERKAFDRAFRQLSTNGLFDIKLEGGETFPALVKTVQMDKRRRAPIHIDFYMVTYGESIEVGVPIRVTGKAKGEIEGGLVDIVTHNVQIIAPGPRRIPAELIVDVSELEIGGHISASQIQMPEDCKLAADPELVVISILAPRTSEAEEPAAAESTDEAAASEAKE